MAKLSKQKAKLHNEVMDLVETDRELTLEEKFFVLENYVPMATHDVGNMGAFFTPFEIAQAFAMNVDPQDLDRVLDLCAGIGALSFNIKQFQAHRDTKPGWFSNGVKEMICLELDDEFIKVGKKVLPEANWIKGSVFDKDIISDIGNVSFVISNPPFGAARSEKVKWLEYSGREFHLKVIEVASKIDPMGSFIVPVGFGDYDIKEKKPIDAWKTFYHQTGIKLSTSFSFDDEDFRKSWDGANPPTEIIEFDDIDQFHRIISKKRGVDFSVF